MTVLGTFSPQGIMQDDGTIIERCRPFKRDYDLILDKKAYYYLVDSHDICAKVEGHMNRDHYWVIKDWVFVD